MTSLEELETVESEKISNADVSDITERDVPPKKKQRIFYGSLETSMQNKNNDGSGAIQTGIEAGNINLDRKPKAPTTQTDGVVQAGSGAVVVGLGQMDDKEKNAILGEFERKRRLRTLAVPTDDIAVRAALREMDEPITLFAEDKGLRRNRLKELTMLNLEEEAEAALTKPKVEKSIEEKEKEQKKQDVWYHEGPKELQTARLFIAEYSIPRARERLEKEREAAQAKTSIVQIQELHSRMKNFTTHSSQIGGDRPLSCAQFSPDGSRIAVSDWSGSCSLWDENCNVKSKLRGHKEQVSWLAWQPQSCTSLSPSAANLASCGHDGAVHLWSLDQDTPIATLEGHSKRVGRVAFHPSGRYLGTTCFDKSWRLWDVEAQKEVLHQEGHSREVFGIAFQKDGAFAVTTGMDALGRAWDLRSGRCIWDMKGHVKNVLAVDIAPDGHYIATGSDDHTIKIWEMRQKKCIYTLPAHNNLVSTVKFEPNNGRYLVSCSFDRTIKIWSHPQWTVLRTLQGHEGKILACDINNDGSKILSAGYDRTFKLWSSGI
eukprot:CFRG5735T1